MLTLLTASTASAIGVMAYEKSQGNLPKIKVEPGIRSNSDNNSQTIPGFETFKKLAQDVNQKAKIFFETKPPDQ